MTNKKLSPLRLIRIAMNMDAKEMANRFEVSSPYISSMENGNRKINEEILLRGLTNLGIEVKDYKELEKFCVDLTETDLEYHDQYRYALLKALGAVHPGFKAETEAFLNMCLIDNALEISTYIKQAQELDVMEADGSLLIMLKQVDDSPKKPKTKYFSLHRLGISVEKYQELSKRFNEISELDLKDDSKCKLLLVLGFLYPNSQKTINKMIDKIINPDPNKVKKIW